VARRRLTTDVRDIDGVLAGLPFDEAKKSAFRTRYLGYADWLERAAARARIAHHGLRLLAALGGIAVTALAALNPENDAVRWAVFAIGLVVAGALALDSLFNLESRWLHYRASAEELKSRLWSFVQLDGAAQGEELEEARERFVRETEAFLRGEVTRYVKGPARAKAGD
jgi:hypothetical protein